MMSKRMIRRFLSVAVSVLMLLVQIPFLSAQADTPVRPEPNGQVFWAADFRDENLVNWISGPHWGGSQSNMTLDSTHKKPFNVSADGLSATLQSLAGDVKAVAATRVQDVDLSTYNTLYLKYNLTDGSDNSVAFLVHGAEDMSAVYTTAGVKYKYVPGTEITDGFIKIPITPADVDGDDLWIGTEIALNTGIKLNIEYLFLGTEDCAADEEQAKWIVENYVAGNPALVFTPARPAANGEVFWAADFRKANLTNWISGPHWGGGQSNMTVDSTHKKPFNVSADGLSATLQSLAGDVKAVAATRVQDVDLSTYNTLYLKYTLTDGSDNSVAFLVHGAEDMSAGYTTAGVKYKYVPGTEITDGFIKIPITPADVDGDDLWIGTEIALNTGIKLNIEYLFLGTEDCALDAAEARQVAENFAAGNPPLNLHVIPESGLATDELVFDTPQNTNQTFMNGAIKIALKINDIAKLQQRENSVQLTDGVNSLTWNLKNYQLQEGKINYLLLPFNEADDALNYALENKRINLQAVTKVRIEAENQAQDLEVEILGCEFVNYSELLESIGVLFYDAASVPSLFNTGLTDGETGKAYQINGDIHSAEYKHDQIPEVFQRMSTENPLNLGADRLPSTLDIFMRVKLLDPIEQFSWQISSVDSGDYASQQRIYSLSYDNMSESVKNETDWQTLSSTIAGQGWTFQQDGALDLGTVQMMRLLSFNRNGTGKGILVDTFYIVDSSIYEGLENLYLYAVSDLDGSNMVQLFKLNGTGSGEEPIDEEIPDDTEDEDVSFPGGDDSDDESDEEPNAPTGDRSFLPIVLFMLFIAGVVVGVSLKHSAKRHTYGRKLR